MRAARQMNTAARTQSVGSGLRFSFLSLVVSFFIDFGRPKPMKNESFP
jgi:hypothetical protein